MNWLARLLRRDRLERELDAELRFHFERQVDDHVQAGMSEDEARRLVRHEFGGLEQMKELCRDVRGTRWVDDFVTDLRVAVRLLARQPGTSMVAVVALALGIGVTHTFFTVVNAVALRGLPIEAVDRVMYIPSVDSGGGETGVSHLDFQDILARDGSFEALAAFTMTPMVIGDEAIPPDRVSGAWVSAQTFRVLREEPLIGRVFTPDDDRPGAPPVVIVGARVWRERYRADPGLLGRTIRVDGVPSTVVGMMRDGFGFPINAGLWRPLMTKPGLAREPRDVRTLQLAGRLLDDVTVEQARAGLNAIAGDLARQYPATNRGIAMAVRPINEQFNARLTEPVWVAFMAAGLLVLLVACANVAALLLMRAVQRTHEIALRASMGATRLRLVRQLLVESATLAVLGGAVGLAVSIAGTRLLSRVLTDEAPYWIRFTLDGGTLMMLAAICLGSVALFGLAPAIHTARASVGAVITEGGRWAAGTVRATRWTGVLLTTEFALSFVLLAAAILGFRSGSDVQDDKLLLEPSRVLTMQLSLPPERYPTPDNRAALHERLLRTLDGLSVVSSAALTSALPYGGSGSAPLEIAGRLPAVGRRPEVAVVAVSPGYFRTLGVPIRRGRDFGTSDTQAFALVNERFVSMHLPGEDPIGRRIRIGGRGQPDSSSWRTILGVVPSLRQHASGVAPDPIVYLPLPATTPSDVSLVIRSAVDSAAVASIVRHETSRLDAELPLYRVRTLEQVLTDARLNGRVSQGLVTVIAGIALALSIVGLYAVTGFAVSRRTREIAVRIALGAHRGDIVRLVMLRVVRQLGIGILAGIACTAVWDRMLGDPELPYRMTDPAVLVLVTTVVGVVAIAACWRPARLAAWLDPVTTLRQE